MQVIDSTKQPQQERTELKKALNRAIDRCAQEHGVQLQLWRTSEAHGVYSYFKVTEYVRRWLFRRWPRGRILVNVPTHGTTGEDGQRKLWANLHPSPLREIFREELTAFGECVGLDVLDLREVSYDRYL